MKRYFELLLFVFCWLFSSVLNVVVVYSLRLFYMTDDLFSDYFRGFVTVVDNLIFFVFGFLCLLLVVLYNVFYQKELGRRFLFVSSIQFMLISGSQLFSAPLRHMLNKSFTLTGRHLLIWSIVFIFSIIAYKVNKRVNQISAGSLFRSLFKLKREKFW